MIDTLINNFHFLRPEWFWALIPVAIAYVWLKVSGRTFSGWQSVIPPHLYQHMVQGKLESNSKPHFGLLTFAWVVTTFALAGPTWERLPQPVYQIKQGHVVVIDMSLSMRATDVTPDRLTRAKYKAIDLVNTIGEGEMGLVAYAGDSFVISPLTQDASNITTLLPSLSPEIMPVPGSDPLLGIESAATLLTNAGYQKGNIYWITDGIEIEQQSELQEYVTGLPFTVNLLAVGTAEGAPIRQVNGELLKSNTGAIVVPTMNASRLRGIASSGSGQFSTLTPDDSDINSLLRSSLLDRESEQNETEDNNQGDAWEEVGSYLLLILLPIVAYGFRKGLVFSLAFVVNASILFGFIGGGIPQAHAQVPTNTNAEQVASSPVVSMWKKPFLNRDQEGLENYDAENYATAASTFDDPAWQGSAHYRAGDYEAALNAYSQLDTIDGLYNQGNALAQLGQFEEAIERYQEVLELDNNHQDAAANKALLEQLQSEQDNQNQDSDENSEQQNQDSDNNQSDESNGDSQQEQSSENNNSQSDNSQEQQQESESQNDSEQNQNNEQSEQSQPSESEEDSQQGESEQEQEQAQSQNEEDNEDNVEEQPASAQASPEELTDEQREQQQRMENLMRRVPDDPAFLLKRKMQLEAQKRQRQRMPANRSEW